MTVSKEEFMIQEKFTRRRILGGLATLAVFFPEGKTCLVSTG